MQSLFGLSSPWGVQGPLCPSPPDAGLTRGQEASCGEKAPQAQVALVLAGHRREGTAHLTQQSGLNQGPVEPLKDSAPGWPWSEEAAGNDWTGGWKPEGAQLGQQQGPGREGGEQGFMGAECMNLEAPAWGLPLAPRLRVTWCVNPLLLAL